MHDVGEVVTGNSSTKNSDTGYRAVEALLRLEKIIGKRYSDVIESVELAMVFGLPEKLRIRLRDGSLMYLRLSKKMKGRYAIHWDCRSIDGCIYRWDNSPHEARRARVYTFPHFHYCRA